MIQTQEPKPRTTVYPDVKLSYHEWVDSLKKEFNVVVSGKFHAKTIEERIKAEDAALYKQEFEREKKTQEEAKPSILFGIKNFLNQF